MRASEGPLAYLVLAGAAMLEYVIPPFPGDTVTLFGIFLAATSGYAVALVYLALTVGSTVGSLGAYAFGRWLGARPERSRRFFKGERARRTLEGVADRFRRHGSWYLAFNRFLPALRAFFFVAAGIARMDVWKVALFGGLSAVVWNALLLAVGFAVGDNWERIRSLSEQYTIATASVVALVAIFFAVRWWVRRRRATTEA